MSRRTATLVVSAVLLAALALVASLLPVPYVALEPGPTANTLGSDHGKQLVTITGHRTYPSDGQLALTTIQVTRADSRLDLAHALRGWLVSDQAIVPRETVYPNDVSAQQIKDQNAEEMNLSQEHATTAALREVGVSVRARPVVGAVQKDSPALGRLHAGQDILAVDGTPVTTPGEVVAAVRRHRPGDRVRFLVAEPPKTEGSDGSDDKARRTLSVRTRPAPEDASIPLVGIAVRARFIYPFQVKIQLDNVGGPSAGLMFALGVVDKLTRTDITAGKVIAGTGTIDDAGNVGPIGGVQMKMRGAARDGATVFLVPAANCREATMDPPSQLRLVMVRTLHGARQALSALRTGTGSVPACP